MTDAEHTWLRAGRVGAPHGLDGSFHVTLPSPQLLSAGETVMLDGSERVIVRRAGHTGHVILGIEGCNDRSAAEALRGKELLVPRDRAPDLEEDEWWVEDLEGLAVRDGERRIGTVQRLLSLPSCDVLEVQRSGSDRADLLVPLIADAVRSVDLDAGEVDVDLAFLGEE